MMSIDISWGIEGNLSLNTIWDYIYMYMEL